MDGETSARLGLPLLQPGQAQKEVTHNEALLLIDMLAQGCVVATGTNAPPAAPSPGACWIVGATPTGAWAGQADRVAGWSAGGWRFVAPAEGMAFWDMTQHLVVRRGANTWIAGDLAGSRVSVAGTQVVGVRQPAIAVPSGGNVTDLQARDTIAAMLGALRSHGLIAG